MEALERNKSLGYGTGTIRRIQAAVGSAPDGVWDPRTVEAVRRFQLKNGLGSDGVVGPLTMSAIELFMDGLDKDRDQEGCRFEDLDLNGVPDVIDRIMLIPIVFESGTNVDAAFRACNRNGEWEGRFDKPKGLPPAQQTKKHWASRHRANGGTSIGLSYGFIQFTQDSGNLGQVLKRFRSIAGPKTMARAFGPNWEDLLSATCASGSSRVRSPIDGSWRSVRVSQVDGADLWQEPWLSRFRAVGSLPEMRAAQRAEAHEGFWMPAKIEADMALGGRDRARLSTIAVAYDVAVQFGVSGMRSRCPDVAGSNTELVEAIIGNLPQDKQARRRYVWREARKLEG